MGDTFHPGLAGLPGQTSPPGGVGRGHAPSPPRARRGAAGRPFGVLWRAHPKEIWAAVKKEPLSFWFLTLYMFIEYVRPQNVYPSIDVIPWGQTFLILSILAMLLGKEPVRLPTAISGLLLLFTFVLVASSITAFSPEAAFSGFPLFLNWILVFILIANVVTTERRFFIFMLAFLLYSFKMSQHGARSWAMNGFGFRDWGVTGGPGWFHNSGEFGIQMCIFFPLAMGFVVALWKHWGKWQRLVFLAFPVTAVMSMIASSSRGALVGGGLVLAWMVARSRYRVRAGLAAAVVVFLVVTVMPPEQRARFETAGEDDTSEARLTLWKRGLDIAAENPALGIGYNNWRRYATVHYGRQLLPHNVFIEAVAELGYTGLSAFVLLIGATFVLNFKTRKVVKALPGDHAFLYQMAHGLDGALIGFIGSGFFVTVLYYPFFWVNLAMTVALHVTALNKARELRAGGTGAVAVPVRVASPRGLWPAGRGGLR